MDNKATVALVLDTKSKDEEKLPKIRVTYNRIPRLYTSNTHIKLTKEQFANKNLKITKTVIDETSRALEIANEIVKNLGVGFSHAVFAENYKKALFGEHRDMSVFNSLLSDYFEYKNVRIKTQKSYKSAMNWVDKYKKDAKLIDITPEFVSKLISFMKGTTEEPKMGENTLRIHLRSLRALYGYAIKEKKLVDGPNPFSKINGQSLTSIGRNSGALTGEEYDKLLSYEPKNDIEKMGQDFFVLSAQLCGANIGDILSFKNKNVEGNKLTFVRRKTRKTGLQIVLTIQPIARVLLNSYGIINPKSPNDYILPYLSKCKDDNAKENTIHDVIKKINHGLKDVCEAIGIRKITTYNARHTYASSAQSSGMTAEQIQKFLGHQSSRTTQAYLKQLQENVIKQNDEVLQGLVGGRYSLVWNNSIS